MTHQHHQSHVHHGNAGELYVPFRIATPDGDEPQFASTIATFGSPLDACVENLAIESFFPADTATAEYLHDFDSEPLRLLADRNPQLLSYISLG